MMATATAMATWPSATMSLAQVGPPVVVVSLVRVLLKAVVAVVGVH